MIIIIIVAGTNAYAMKPFCGSVIHEWNKQFELSKGIDSYARLGKEKPTAIYLSRVHEPVQPGKPGNHNDENALQKVAQSGQNAPKRASQSEENTSQKTVQIEQNSQQNVPQTEDNASQKAAEMDVTFQPVLIEFRHFSDPGRYPLDLPTVEDLYCHSELWGCLFGSTAICSVCRDSAER